MQTAAAWAWWIAAQLISFAFTLIGLVALIPFCVLRAWRPCMSQVGVSRTVDEWTWVPLNYIYGQPEDGVSGQRALVKGQPYKPGSNDIWRAYCWSALRNSCDELKYRFAWSNGPYVYRQYTAFGATHELRLGWQWENNFKVLVLSLW